MILKKTIKNVSVGLLNDAIISPVNQMRCFIFASSSFIYAETQKLFTWLKFKDIAQWE